MALVVLSAPVAAAAQPSGSLAPKEAGSAAGAMLLVEGPAVVEVAASSLAEALDSTPEAISRLLGSGGLDLRLGGESIAWHAVDDGAALRFVTPEVRSPFSRHHRVGVSMAQGMTMQERTLIPESAEEPHAYLETLRLEEDLFPGPSGAPDPRQDLFFWHALSSNAEVAISVGLRALGEPSAVELRVYVHGATEHPDQPFRIELHWKGQSVGIFERTKVTGRLRVNGEVPPTDLRAFYVTPPGGGHWVSVALDAEGRFETKLEPGKYTAYYPETENNWTGVQFEVPDAPTYQLDLGE